MKLNIYVPIAADEQTIAQFGELAKLVSMPANTTEVNREAAIEAVLAEWDNNPGVQYKMVATANGAGEVGKFSHPAYAPEQIEHSLVFQYAASGQPQFTPHMDARCFILRMPHEGKDYWLAHINGAGVKAYGDPNNAVEIGSYVIETHREQDLQLSPAESQQVNTEFFNRLYSYHCAEFFFSPPFHVTSLEHLALVKQDVGANFKQYAQAFVPVGLPYRNKKGETFFVFDDPQQQDASRFRVIFKIGAKGDFSIGKGERAEFHMFQHIGGQNYAYPINTASPEQYAATIACDELCRIYANAKAERDTFVQKVRAGSVGVA